MKKILSIIAVMALTLSVGLATDYSHHMYNQRTYRVALGAGNVPSAADMALVRLHNGDTVLNTDDDVLYIMHETNVYTKITAAGAMTIGDLSAETVTATSVSAALVSVDTTVTNTQEITLSASAPVINLTSFGQADTYTNTITIAQPYPVGYQFLIRVTSASTNRVLIADSTTVLALGSDANLGATDTLVIYTAATNEAVRLCTSTN